MRRDELAAWRDKDQAFVGALLREGLLDADLLLERLDATAMASAHRARLRRFITAMR